MTGAAATLDRRSTRATALVFLLLLCLYGLTAGGQGYSVDGTFSYEVARSLATDPARAFIAQNADTLRRWGPVVPALGTPLAWMGARLAEVAPPRDSLALDGRRYVLHDWEPAKRGAPVELVFDAPLTGVIAVQAISSLALSVGIAQDTPVAEIILLSASPQTPGQTVGRAVLLAGRHTAEWAHGLPGSDAPRHSRPPVAGYWPGNPQARLYAARVPVEAAGPVSGALVRYLAPEGALYLRSLLVQSSTGEQAAQGPSRWGGEEQSALFTRFVFSFLNVPLMALTCALLVPLGRLLGYRLPAAVAVATGAGVTTFAWPYAKHDFSEPAAALFMLAAVVMVFGWAGVPRGWAGPALLVAAGASAGVAAGAKYTAAWLLPLLAVQIILLALTHEWQRSWPARTAGVARALLWFAALPLVAGMVFVLIGGRAPTIWGGWRDGLARGWLDFPLWVGLYGLLFSPGKSLILYAPTLLLAVAGVALFIRRHRAGAFLFLAVPLVYLAVFGSKGVWHGGGWGPRYLVSALPFIACLALPVVERLLSVRSGFSPGRVAAAGLVVVGIGVQFLAVAKHPNLYTVMFRDHILPALPAYGVALGGAPAEAYWRHFGGPGADRQLARPPERANESGVRRGLGYLYEDVGPLNLSAQVRAAGAYDLTLYVCDWDRRERRQRITVRTAAATQTYGQNYDFSACEYLTWPVQVAAGEMVSVSVEATVPNDVPVLSALFLDPASGEAAAGVRRTPAQSVAWPERFGTRGYVLFAWQRGADVAAYDRALAGVSGGRRVWLDTWEFELSETPLLYAPGFSPLLGHAWLLGADLISLVSPGDHALLQRALASPPWRYVHRAEIHSPHPEYGLGLDFWPLLLRSHFRSHPVVMNVTWAVVLALAAGAITSGWLLYRTVRVPRVRPSVAPQMALVEAPARP